MEKPLLRVTVLQGVQLKNMEFWGKQDPYCKIFLGTPSRACFTATVNRGGRAPRWPPGTGTVELGWSAAASRDDLLHIEIWDEDDDKDDDFVGECCLNVPALAATSGGFKGMVQVYRNGTEASGGLYIEVVCQDIVYPEPQRSGRQLVQATPSKVHRNHFSGVLHALEEGDDLKWFKTYEVALQSVDEVFAGAWSHGKDGIHPESFVDGMKGALIRTALSATHKALYMDEMFGVSGPGGLRTSTRFLGSGSDFLDMIKWGIRDKKRRVYTYSITEAGMFFSETGAAFSKDNTSKHIIHADAAMAVRYAGTFRICERSPGEPVLVVDNDSGTYAPQAKHQPLLRRVLEMNFAGLEILTLDVLAPQPAWSCQLFGPNECKSDPRAVYAGTWSWRDSVT